MRFTLSILFLTTLLIGLTFSQQPIFTPLGDLPGGSIFSKAFSTSDDGRVIVGESQTDQGILGFVWQEGQGMLSIGTIPGQNQRTFLWGVSSDGTIATGFGDGNVGGDSAFTWTQTNGIVGIGELTSGNDARSRSISGDGLTVVGMADNNTSFEPFQWTATTGMVGLGYFPGGSINGGEA